MGLIRAAVEPGGTWADIGAGQGAFTLALADLLGPGGRVVAVDRDARVLRANADAVRARFPALDYATLTADLTGSLDLPELDGLVAANSLHYVPRDRQVAVIRALAAHLRPGRSVRRGRVRRRPRQPVGPAPVQLRVVGAARPRRPD